MSVCAMRSQRGSTTVEFAIVGVPAVLVLLACLEIGRMLFVWNTVAEATRRGARVAVVSAVGSASVTAAVMTFSPFLDKLKGGNISVTYYDSAGAVTADPDLVRYARVAVTDYTFNLMLPFVDATVAVPAFSTTLPAESLGFDPDV